VLDHALRRLYGRGNFEYVDYRLEPGTPSVLELGARRNSWGPNYVRFGLSLEDDFNGSSRYNAAARFVIADIGPRAGEWAFDLQWGSEPRFATELYWPLDDAVQTFLMPTVSVSSRDVLREQYRLRTSEYGVDLGREFDNVAEARIGIREVRGRVRLREGAPLLIGQDFDSRELFGRITYDVLDSRNFPRRGELLSSEWRRERDRSIGGVETDLLTAEGLFARSRGRNTGVLWVSYGTALDESAGRETLRTQFPLGGFLNLSGLAPESIAGRHFAIARLMMYRQIGRGGEGFLNVPAYLGVSLESGNVWDRRGDIGFDSARTQGSVFLGLDTLFGPVYLGSGFGEGGESALYLFLGRTF
jgi:NTE family protein